MLAVTLWDAFVRHAGLEDPDLRSTVLAVSAIPYGRPATLSPLGVLEDRCGTCSTKHLLLQNVHTFARALLRERVTVDVTFPVAEWDGHSPMAVASGPGEDHPAGHDPLATKKRLVARNCDPAQREPFIAELARYSRSRRSA